MRYSSLLAAVIVMLIVLAAALQLVNVTLMMTAQRLPG